MKLLSLLIICSIVSATIPADALPLFARKYNTTCFTCHVSPPLLNDFGERFRSNGFELPGVRADNHSQKDDEQILPIAFIAHPVVAHVQATDNIYSRVTKKAAVQGLGFDLLSSAAFGGHFSYFTEVEVEAAEDETEVALGMLYALYTDVLNDGSGILNLRAGKMHFVPSLTHTSYLANTDPLIYGDYPFSDTVITKNDLHFAHATIGAAAYGVFTDVAEGLFWELGYTSGTKNEVDLRAARAVFGSLNQAIELGSFRMEAGAFYFGGRQQIVIDGYLLYPRINNHYRSGFALKLFDPWINRISLYGQYVLGHDDNSNYWGIERKVTGSIVGLHAILFPEKLYAFARYDMLDADDGIERSMTQIDVGLRYHLLSNVILTAGFTRQDIESGMAVTTSGGHSHSIAPATPLSGSHSSSGTTGTGARYDVTTTSINFGILLAY